MSLAAVSLASVFLLTSCTATPETSITNNASTTETVYTTPAGGSMFEVDGATAKITGSTGDYTLTISDVNTDMTWFTDRPMREAGNTQTSSLPSLWTEGGVDSFEKTPPNATLTVKNNGKSETFVGELSQPALSGSALSFKVKPIEEISSSLVGKTLSNPVLVIDAAAASVTVGQPNEAACSTGTYCNIYIPVTNTSGETYIGNGEISTPPWYVDNPVTITVTLSNTTQLLEFTPTGGWTAGSISNGLVTVTTNIGVAPGGSTNIQLSYGGPNGSFQNFTVVSCTSSIGNCAVG